MLSVEDALETLADLVQDSKFSTGGPVCRFNKWDESFILDMDCHVKESRPVSTNQAKIILKLIKSHRFYLERSGIPADAIDALLLTPYYRIPPYQSTVLPREVRWAGDNRLAFRCKYNEGIVDDIKRLRWHNPLGVVGQPMFSKPSSLWLVTVTDDNVEQVMSVIQRHKFGFDADVEQLFLRVVNATKDRGSIEVDGDRLAVETSNDHFMNAWMVAAMRLEGQDV